MMELAYALAQKWCIGEVLDIVTVDSGTSCACYRITAASGSYILRGFTSQRQAEQEQVISQLFADTGIGARLIPTHYGTYYLPHCDYYYNLQTFLPGIQPDFSEENQIIAAGKATAELHRALASCRYPFSDYDRFSAIPLFLQAKEMPLPASLFPEWATTVEGQTEYIMALEKQLSSKQVIHGDLGAWNMLWNGDTIYIIDFGECRTGDIHFDLAAIVCSILSKCGDKALFSKNLTLLLDSYTEIAGPIDFQKLNTSVCLWMLRGAFASAVRIQEPVRKEQVCKQFAYELLRFQHYMGIYDADNHAAVRSVDMTDTSQAL